MVTIPLKAFCWTAAVLVAVVMIISVPVLSAGRVAGQTAKRSLAGHTLRGAVKTGTGEALAGAAVSVKGVGKTITTSVYTDEKGMFVFPDLEKGTYTTWAQAVGFDRGEAQLNLDPQKEATQSFTLNPAKDVFRQLSGAEWMMTLPDETPADRRMKFVFHNTCTGCHSSAVALQNRFDEKGWRAIVTAMSTADPLGQWHGAPSRDIEHYKEELVTYLNRLRGPGPSPLKPKLLPRPSGESARVVVTEFDVPSALAPDEANPDDGSDWSEGVASIWYSRGLHDMTVDRDGNPWASQSVVNSNRTIVKVNAKTGEVTGFKVARPDGYARQSHGIATAPDGTIWFNVYAELDEFYGPGSGLATIDPKTGRLAVYNPPQALTNGVGWTIDADKTGRIWVPSEKGILAFHMQTKEFRIFEPKPGQQTHPPAGAKAPPNGRLIVGDTYGVAADANGNGWWTEPGRDNVGWADFKTGKSGLMHLEARHSLDDVLTDEDRKFYSGARGGSANYEGGDQGPRPPWQRQFPRRMGADKNGNSVWVGNYNGQNLARIDINTHQVKYYPGPIPYTSTYDTDVDSKGMVWVNLHGSSERVLRFNPKTEQWTTFMFPVLGGETRFIVVDQFTDDVWLPYWRNGKLARMQFRTPEETATSAR